MCLSLTACDGGSGTASGKIIDKDISGPTGATHERTIEFGFTWTFGGRGMMRAMNAAGAVDAADIAVDISTYNTVVLDGTGTGILTAKQGDTVLGTTTFTYVVYDSMAIAANPAAVNAWLTNFPSADGYGVSLEDVQTIDTAPGVATMTAEAVYGTTVVTSASSYWASSGGGGCGNPGVGDGGDPFPQMPEIDDPGAGCP